MALKSAQLEELIRLLGLDSLYFCAFWLSCLPEESHLRQMDGSRLKPQIHLISPPQPSFQRESLVSGRPWNFVLNATNGTVAGFYDLYLSLAYFFLLWQNSAKNE